MPLSSFFNATTKRPHRVVVKLGTGVLTSGVGQLNEPRVAAICAQIAALRAQGTEVIVVSSGAIGLGLGALRLLRRPKETAKKQACAAIGQSMLMQVWQRAFAPLGIVAAQVLLTHEDIRSRDRYLSVKACLEQILAYGAVPVINENDTVSSAEIQEIRFGDNDTLSALVASLAEAQYLFILSTAPGLIDMQGTGQIVPVVSRITPDIEAMAGGTTSATAVGGMITKISAAKLATRAGCGVFIASGAEADILPRILQGTGPGTFFVPSGLPLEAKKRWLAFFQRPTGTIRINSCAIPVLRDQGRSLLAVGVTGAEGSFVDGDVVNVAGPDGTVLARGRTRFGSSEIANLAGKHGDAMRQLFPSRKHLEVIHRDDLVLL
ncbi:glutamate 5-kinase [Opitutus sp. ER46]|uniref:glutamate 5-kinase n=1 Tax=Opitutus sp. ER46 TaxID=2161864 RepID=UPI000D2F740C|nr:glutamate 5-kinase [Opitutus sp. ER46]PTX90647.1 glutamate 5-kinase [Opitutus sp. ER46]